MFRFDQCDSIGLPCHNISRSVPMVIICKIVTENMSIEKEPNNEIYTDFRAIVTITFNLIHSLTLVFFID